MYRRKPSPATMIASAALFVALGGTAVAASRFVITSTSQIKPSVLRAFKPRITRVETPMTSVEPDSVETVRAFCPSGSEVVGGGGFGGAAGLAASEPIPGNRGWFIIVNDLSATTPIHVRADAECIAG
jgi:hypothetical protein